MMKLLKYGGIAICVIYTIYKGAVDGYNIIMTSALGVWLNSPYSAAPLTNGRVIGVILSFLFCGFCLFYPMGIERGKTLANNKVDKVNKLN